MRRGSLFQKKGVKEADQYRINNAPQKIYKFMPFFDRGNPHVNKRNIETLGEKKVWASKYFSLNDPFEFNGMYLDEEKILASGNSVDIYQMEVNNQSKKFDMCFKIYKKFLSHT